MGGACCKGNADKWPTDFSSSAQSSNKCDAEWESVTGEEATFGMGSHWGPCARFGAIPGVIRVRVGFSGGMQTSDEGSPLQPTYSDPKGNTEVVHLEFDPATVTFEKLLESFWAYHDSTLDCDTQQYMSTIFTHGDQQDELAQKSLNGMTSRVEKRIFTRVLPFEKFYPVEDEYQHYLLQQQKLVFERLKIPMNQLRNSHLASRVEGYVCGYAKPEQFDSEVPYLYLPEGMATLIRMKCVENQPAEDGADRFF